MKRLLLGFAVLLAGCSSTHVIEADFPVPLVEAIPVSVYLDLSEEFLNYRFEQPEEDRDDLTVVLGNAQTQLFRTVMGALFESLSENPDQSFELMVTPDLNAFQYSLPKETGGDFYEVWMKYRLQVRSSDDSISDWLISGYGRATNERIQSQGAGVNEATEEALRDIGVQLAIGFAQQDSIQAWLQQRSD